MVFLTHQFQVFNPWSPPSTQPEWTCKDNEFIEKEKLINEIEKKFGIKDAASIERPTCKEKQTCKIGLEMYLYISFCAEYDGQYTYYGRMVRDQKKFQKLLKSSSPVKILLSLLENVQKKYQRLFIRICSI